MTNEEKFMKLLAQVDPDLYRIKVALHSTGVNPIIMPRVIRSIANLAIGSGYGKVQVFMEKRTITAVKGEESDLLNINAMENDEEIA